MGKITTYYKGDMLFESKLGNHSVTIDVPAEMGGSDRAPTPPEFFVASLGACVAAFVARYCTDHGIDTTDMSVDVTFDKVPDPTRLTNMKVLVHMPHADCGNREKALLRVAEHCPVHETMETLEGVEIKILDSKAMAMA